MSAGLPTMSAGLITASQIGDVKTVIVLCKWNGYVKGNQKEGWLSSGSTFSKFK